MNSIDLSNTAGLKISYFRQVGSAGSFNGTIGSISDTGEVGMKLNNSDRYRITGGDLLNISGTGLDIQASAGGWQHIGQIHGVRAKDCYRGFWLHNSAEYETVSDCWADNSVWGFKIDSGNNSFSNCKARYCYNAVQINGGASNPNDAHGTWTGLISNHSVYNLSCANVTNGEVFSGCCFIAGLSGGYDAGGGIQIYNSQGIVITGSQIGLVDVSLDATSALSLVGNVFRGTVKVTVATGGALNAKANIVMPGATVTLNGVAWSGNN